jgi:predicted outer membrane protein
MKYYLRAARNALAITCVLSVSSAASRAQSGSGASEQGAASGGQGGSGQGAGAGGQGTGANSGQGTGSEEGSGSSSGQGARAGQGTGDAQGTRSGARQGGASGQGNAGGTSSGLQRSSMNQQTSDASRSAGGQNQHSQLERMIALDLLLGNQEEVALARLAQQRAENEEVRQFADSMIKDHEKAISELKRMMPHLASVQIGDSAGTSAGSPSAGQANAHAPASSRGADTGAGNHGTTAGGAAQVAASQAGGDPARFHQDVARHCLELVKSELQEHQGAEFDMAYMGQQMSAHITMLAKLQASEQATSAELKDFVTHAIPMVQHHRMMAKEIKMKLKQSEQGGTNRRESAAQRTTPSTR